MRELVQSVLAFVLGLVIGMFLFSQLLLPLLYGLPRSIYLVLRGELRPTAILYYLVVPFVWLLVLAGVITLGFLAAPRLTEAVLSNDPFNLGGLLALVLVVLNIFRSEGRKSMREDFEQTSTRFARRTP